MEHAMTPTSAQNWDLYRRFLACDVSEAEWDHHAHVRTAWCYLLQHGLPATLARFGPDLRRVIQSFGGDPSAYHETITVAMLRVMAGRLHTCSQPDCWETFLASAPELLDWKNPVLLRYYSKPLLFSDRARAAFVAPDLRPLPEDL